MEQKLTVTIVGAGEEEEGYLRGQLADLLEIVSSEPDPALGMSVIRRDNPSIALLYLDHNRPAIFSLSTKLAGMNGCVPVIVSRDRNPDTILAAMRSGAKDFAFLEPEGVDVRRVLLDLSFSVHPDAAEATTSHLGKVIAVFSSKGGSGSTTIAANLAGALLPEDRKSSHVALLDLDFQMGDILAFLDLLSRYTWRDLIHNMHRLDADLLYQSLTLHSSGLHLVAQSDVLEEADELEPKEVVKAITFLRRFFDFIVIDGLRDFSEISLLALDLADKVLVTMTQDIPALKNANRCLTLFRELGYGKEKVKLVLNRYLKRGELSVDAIADALQMPIAATVSNDFPTVIKSLNEGALLTACAPRAAVTRDIHALVQLVRGEAPPPRRSWFGRRGKE